MKKHRLFLEEKIKKNLSPEPVFRCRDHTVSQREFSLYKHPEYDMLVTFPAPENSELPEFYKSESYISHTDSRRSIFEKAYQGVKSYMLDKKLSWIEEQKKEQGRILDIGAGTGDFLFRAKSRGWSTEGLEPNSDARRLAESKGITLREDSSNFAVESFDVITMWHVLEHVPDLEKQIKELQRLLKPNGILVIAVPNFKSHDAKIYKDAWAAFDVPRHLWHFSRTSIETIFDQFAFKVFRLEPLEFDAYYVSLLSERYRSGNPLQGIWNGLLSNLKARNTREYSSLAYFLRKSSKNAK